jgi:hypothetical protein
MFLPKAHYLPGLPIDRSLARRSAVFCITVLSAVHVNLPRSLGICATQAATAMFVAKVHR